MLDHYLICLDSCETGQQIDALANKAFDHLPIVSFNAFIEKAIEKLDSIYSQKRIVCQSSMNQN
jgi:hypothetical protein